MKEEFKNYLNDIGFTQIVINRVEEIHEIIESIFSIEITDIFVEDYIKGSEREYDALYFFSENLSISAVNFRVEAEFRAIYLSEHIVNMRVLLNDYNIKDEEFNDNSKLIVEIETDQETYDSLKSAKNNCNYLKKILTKYLIPNMKK